MTVAGLVLGGYVYAAWPDTTPRVVRLPYGESMPKTPAAKPHVARTTAAVMSEESYPELELAGVAGVVYPGYLSVYEVSATPLLDAVIQAPATVDVR
ncbi:MAG TPA: hypothetical protein VFV62_04400 [Gaiellaceae bacterium]|nr:hypothetical protein [Gaiellaceae bacterium]